MTIDSDNIKAYVYKRPYNPELLRKSIQEIANVVISRHFSSYLYLQEDLISLAYEKSISLLKSKHLSFQYNIVTFLYSGIRNSMGNYLRRQKREQGHYRIQPGEWDALAIPQETKTKFSWETLKIGYDKIRSSAAVLGIDLPECPVDLTPNMFRQESMFGWALKASFFRAIS